MMLVLEPRFSEPTVAKVKVRMELGPKFSGLPRSVPLPLPASEEILRMIRLPEFAPERSSAFVTVRVS